MGWLFCQVCKNKLWKKTCIPCKQNFCASCFSLHRDDHRAEQERLEREKQEQEKQERLKREAQERVEREKHEREKQEQERLEREKQERLKRLLEHTIYNFQGVLVAVGPIYEISRLPRRNIIIRTPYIQNTVTGTSSKVTVMVTLIAEHAKAIETMIPLVEVTTKKGGKYVKPAVPTTINLEHVIGCRAGWPYFLYPDSGKMSIKQATQELEQITKAEQKRLKERTIKAKQAIKHASKTRSNITLQGALDYVSPLKDIGKVMYREIAIRTLSKGVLIYVTLFGTHTNFQFPRATPPLKPVIIRLENVTITKYEGESYYSLGQHGKISIEQS